MSEPVTKQRLLEHLKTERYGKNIFVFPEIDSTNACAMTLAETGAEEGTVVWSEFQTAGRGRHGRVWVGDRGKNLMFSVVIRGIPREGQTLLPYYISEAVAGGVEKALPVTVSSKWPNDLLIDDRKFCGTLIEGNHTEGVPFAVAGIGINVNQRSFPDNLLKAATSLSVVLDRDIDRVSLYQAVIENLEALLEEVRTRGDAAILDAWGSRCSTLGRTISIRYGSERVDGKALGLSPDGGLLVETSDGLRTVYAGDVTEQLSERGSIPSA